MTPMHTWLGALLACLSILPARACDGTPEPDGAAAIDAPDLRGIAVYLPKVLENSEAGPFADLLKVVGRYYRAGRISFSIEPVKRVYLDTSDKSVDFRFPIMKIRDGADRGTPFQFSREMLGKVSFVIYSNKEKPFGKADLQRMATLPKYEIAIHAPPANWDFPASRVVNLELSLKQLNLGRIDAVVWAQEDADYLVRKDRLDNIHREHLDDYPDVLFFSCNKRGDFANQAMSAAIRAARDSGELQKAYARVHQPYQDWQP